MNALLFVHGRSDVTSVRVAHLAKGAVGVAARGAAHEYLGVDHAGTRGWTQPERCPIVPPTVVVDVVPSHCEGDYGGVGVQSPRQVEAHREGVVVLKAGHGGHMRQQKSEPGGEVAGHPTSSVVYDTLCDTRAIPGISIS